MLILGSDFRKQGEGKVIYHACFFGGLGFKEADAERMLLHFLTQGTRSLSNAMSSCGQWLSFSLLVQDEASASQSIAFGCMLVAGALDVAS